MDDLKAAIDAINPNSTDEEWTKLLAEAMNAAARIEALEGALSDLVRSCSSTPVAMGDGGTYIVGPPTVDALRAATILLREQG